MRILRTLRLDLRREQEDALHIMLTEAVEDPEAFKDPQGP